MPQFYKPDLGANPDDPFARGENDKLVRRGFWLDMSDRSLVLAMTIGIGAGNSANTVLKFANTTTTVGTGKIIATAAPSSFQLTVGNGDASFSLGTFNRVDSNTGAITTVNVSPILKVSATDGTDGTDANTTIEDLIADINAALAAGFVAAGVPLQVVAGQEADGRHSKS